MSNKPTVFNYQEYVGLKGKYEDLKLDNKEMAARINTLRECIDQLLNERANLEIKVRFIERDSRFQREAQSDRQDPRHVRGERDRVRGE